MKTSSTRTLAREFAFQFLYHFEDKDLELIKSQIASGNDLVLADKLAQLRQTIEIDLNPAHYDFAIKLIKASLVHFSNSQALFEKHSTNWKFNKIPKIEKIILLIIIAENLEFPTSQAPILINEAVNMARKYGSAESKNFINGILDAIFQNQKNPNHLK